MSDLGPLIGTPSKITIYDDGGHIIVKEGEIITYGVIDRARDAGRLDDLRMAESVPSDIVTATEFEEIGVEDPEGVRPESG